MRAAYNITDFQIVDAPNWTRAKRFDIVAKGSASGGPAQVFLMLRDLLAEHFHLAVHTEKREMPVYALVKAGGSLGPSLRPAAADCATIMAGVRRGLPAPRRPMRVVLHGGAGTARPEAGADAPAGGRARRRPRRTSLRRLTAPTHTTCTDNRPPACTD